MTNGTHDYIVGRTAYEKKGDIDPEWHSGVSAAKRLG